MILPTRRWLMVLAALGALALLATVWPAATLVWIAADLAWLVALAIDGVRVSRIPPSAIEVERQAPPAFSVGHDMPVVYRWHQHTGRVLNVSVREALPVRLQLVGADRRQLRLADDEPYREEFRARPLRRGREQVARMDLRLEGPWGLAMKQQARVLPWTVLVYPDMSELAVRALPTSRQRRRDAGQRNVRHLGEGRVFESLKEWVPGEDTRTIDWKATAKRGKPMARRFEDERRQHVLIVVDAGRLLTTEVDGVPRLEAVVQAALQLAHSAVSHDDNIGLMVFADRVQTFVPPARGRRALRQVVDALATMQGKVVESDYPGAFAYLAARNRRRALTVLFTDVIDRTASEALVAQSGTLRPRHIPVAVTLRDPQLERTATTRPATVVEAFDRASAEDLLLAREDALADMRNRGVIVLDVAPANAAEAVVHQYAWLKRRGVL
ncbi:MAG: DUF58 domain-containing protein [Gemmatimonadaceae bacterium]